MELLNIIKEQLKLYENTEPDTTLPWTVNNQEFDDNKTNKFNVQKLAKYGLIFLVLIIIIVASFNYFLNSSSVSVNTSNEDNEGSKAQQIQVHVAGEVNKPGVYTLEANARIMDAVNAAGGFTAKADQNALNLAKNVEDGEQIKIESIGSSDVTTNQSSGTSQNNNGKININTADLSQLQTLSGVGPSTAQKIIDYRNANGKFKSIDEIKNVSGIGEKTFAKFANMICI